jgi:predicted RND superfamily exporter protein
MMTQQLAGQVLPAPAGNLTEQLQDVPRRLAEVRGTLRRMSRNEYLTRTTQYQSAVAGDLLTRLQTLRAMAVAEPPTLADLPESLVERFVGKGGKHLMRIYTTANIWNMDEMEKFVTAIRSVDPKATGGPLQTYEASLQMLHGYKMAGLYAFFAIFAFLYLDFRNVKEVVMVLVPMLTGLGMMFGILGWLDVPLNPANLIVLPLIFGIGIDHSVHMIHEFRKQKGRFQLPASMPTAILMTTLTTFVGFGSMMIASHRGLQSLGRVLVIGVACCTFTSLVMLPAALTWWTRNRNENDAIESPPELLDETPIEEFSPLTIYVADEEIVTETVPFEQPQKQRRLVKRKVA